MRWIMIAGTGLALLAGIMNADAQGIGYGPGVNPSNPQDLIGRSNPQDLSAPGGSNRQDLVRQPSGARPVVTSPSRTTAARYTGKTKAKQKAAKRSTAARR